mmetsp:Transcript_34237/g.84175  ORF Transcript_34237/g.84175 Transcript_34237/m.84175 type:complete len:244 (+) Transcript_34237:374-1105(+)
MLRALGEYLFGVFEPAPSHGAPLPATERVALASGSTRDSRTIGLMMFKSATGATPAAASGGSAKARAPFETGESFAPGALVPPPAAAGSSKARVPFATGESLAPGVLVPASEASGLAEARAPFLTEKSVAPGVLVPPWPPFWACMVRRTRFSSSASIRPCRSSMPLSTFSILPCRSSIASTFWSSRSTTPPPSSSSSTISCPDPLRETMCPPGPTICFPNFSGVEFLIPFPMRRLLEVRVDIF